ncbi:MAG: lectin like domain-containing protein, partial [Oscillospiraceae bacterium]
LLNNMQNYDPSDISSIKKSVYNNGSVFLSYYNSSAYLNSETYGYYCPTDISPDHAVSIVGWDDNYSKNNFIETPPADGAWIIKNSWGSDWGDNGLFYMSYFDAGISTVGSLTMEDKGDIDNIYQYDGNTQSIVRAPNYGVTGANIFTSDSDEILEAVSFWTTEAEVPYNIKIYVSIPEGGTPSDGILVYSQSGYETYAGYHKVDLNSDINLCKGCRYAVVVDLMKTNTYMRLDSYASGTGVSFYSAYRSSYDWKDAAVENTKNVCIKAFTSESHDSGVHIDKSTFPNNSFRMIVSQYDTDNNSYLSDAEISSVTKLFISKKEIGSLKGIQYFTELTALNCSNNALSELDLTNNKKLQQLNCANNSLTELDLSENPKLDLLYCADNQISELDLSYNPEIYLLVCSGNKLTELDVSCLPKLQILYCSFTDITQLDLSENQELITVYCNNSKLTALDASGCTKLQELHCYTNQIDSIDLSETASLTELKCYENQLSELDLSDCTSLQTINCSFNSLQKLDLTNNTCISYIQCSDNKLKELLIPDIEKIDTLYCNNNELAFFNLDNTDVSYFSIENNVRNIGNVISEFKLSSFEGFDPSNVIRYSGAAFDAEKNVFTDFEKLTVTYYYYCGQRKYATFTLQADSFMTLAECIDYVNSIDLSESYTELSDEQLEAITFVLEYDYGK